MSLDVAFSRQISKTLFPCQTDKHLFLHFHPLLHLLEFLILFLQSQSLKTTRQSDTLGGTQFILSIGPQNQKVEILCSLYCANACANPLHLLINGIYDIVLFITYF